MIDFRSDTVTKPSKEMLDSIVNARVGDDEYLEDPEVNELQEYCASLFGCLNPLSHKTGKKVG